MIELQGLLHKCPSGDKWAWLMFSVVAAQALNIEGLKSATSDIYWPQAATGSNQLLYANHRQLRLTESQQLSNLKRLIAIERPLFGNEIGNS